MRSISWARRASYLLLFAQPQRRCFARAHTSHAATLKLSLRCATVQGQARSDLLSTPLRRAEATQARSADTELSCFVRADARAVRASMLTPIHDLTQVQCRRATLTRTCIYRVRVNGPRLYNCILAHHRPRCMYHSYPRALFARANVRCSTCSCTLTCMLPARYCTEHGQWTVPRSILVSAERHMCNVCIAES